MTSVGALTGAQAKEPDLKRELSEIANADDLMDKVLLQRRQVLLERLPSEKVSFTEIVEKSKDDRVLALVAFLIAESKLEEPTKKAMFLKIIAQRSPIGFPMTFVAMARAPEHVPEENLIRWMDSDDTILQVSAIDGLSMRRGSKPALAAVEHVARKLDGKNDKKAVQERAMVAAEKLRTAAQQDDREGE